VNTRHIFGHVFSLEVAIAAVVFGLVVLTVVFAAGWSRLHRRSGPSQTVSHPRLEIAFVSVVTAVAVFLVVLSTSANATKVPGRPGVRVLVTGFQWCWRFSYTGTPVSVTATCSHGDYPTLELPTNTVIQVSVTSSDVVHSMWVPYLRYKMDAFPDHINTFTTMVDHPGSYAGRCASFCGLYHDSMDFTVKAVTAAQFHAWLSSQEQALGKVPS
jgi:cytochrome c oxidase subunit 2